ncbi:amidase [Sinimarinibacterium sp. CAU 1509]|uniref:amidase n=1 Tax=Sinimarinibacterium sp. CAU 1509 TaxID=2562283 RepID=UPI001B7FD60C|nr:amidase [Sinimarinibacterium sp. CAU 1509]
MSEPLQLSATALARAIRARHLRSLDIVEAHIARIERVNPTINAVVQQRFDAARDEARAADAAIDQGRDDLPPLHGVPCTIKENFAFAGFPQVSGLVARRDAIANADAPTVARLRRAGAIVLGFTNTSELCMWLESNNRVYGRTNNPYDPRCMVGGSSGGEGAIIGAGASPFGLGADVGGSIRFPAFFNGVFGHKPTPGIVPNTGQYPLPEGRMNFNCVTGPLARRAEDLWPLLQILAGADGVDPEARDGALSGDPAAVDVSALRVLSIEHNGRHPVAADLRAAQRGAADWLGSQGRGLSTPVFPAMKRSFEIWSALMQQAQPQPFAEQLGQGRRISVARELLKLSVGRSDHTVPALVLARTGKRADAGRAVCAPRRRAACGTDRCDRTGRRAADAAVFQRRATAQRAAAAAVPLRLLRPVQRAWLSGHAGAAGSESRWPAAGRPGGRHSGQRCGHDRRRPGAGAALRRLGAAGNRRSRRGLKIRRLSRHCCSC